MKLMKRILAVVCTFVMIISMATGVNAVNDSSTTAATTETGKITINNAIAGEKYKAYKILTLDSYSETAKAYSYKKTNDQWAKFINERSDFFKTNENGYVTFIGTDDAGTAARRIAIYAIGFAKKNNVDATKTVDATSTSVVFDKLDLGYYVIESTSGTACAIATTNPSVTVENKHSNPHVNKVIKTGGKLFDNDQKNSVNLGEFVTYITTIYVKPGAKNYVLHDKMNPHLEFQHFQDVSGNDNRKFYANKKDGTSDYIITPDVVTGTKGPTDGCTFHVEFTSHFYSKYQEAIDRGELTEIYVKYVAKVKDDESVPVNKPMKNTTWLTYGENNTKTEKSETETYTYGIPVFKYTGNDAGLAGAKFILSTKSDANEQDAIKFDPIGKTYRYTADQETGDGITTLESPVGGHFTIDGLEAGKYYLKETEAPKGYNKIQKSIEIEILAGGTIKVDGTEISDGIVKVQNNTGSLLPSTGGMGTTLIYVVGSILVLASGIVLFSKRKEGTN